MTANSLPVAENQLPRKFDPENFQWMHAGKVMPLASMSREDLLQVACECMVVLERMESLQEDMARLSATWRAGDVTPDTDESAGARG